MIDFHSKKRTRLLQDKLDKMKNPAKSSLMHWVILMALVVGFAIGIFTSQINIVGQL